MKYQIAFALLMLCFSRPAFACSAVCAYPTAGARACADNLDLPSDIGETIYISPAGMQKTAVLSYTGTPGVVHTPLTWTSLYATLQTGYAGTIARRVTNSAGLFATLHDSNPATASAVAYVPGLPEITVLQFLTYLADTCATINDVGTAIKKINLTQVFQTGFSGGNQFMVCDTSQCGAVEAIGGQLVLTAMSQVFGGVPVTAYTNDHYADSMAYLLAGVFTGPSTSSLNRFVTAAEGIPSIDSSSPPVTIAVETMDRAIQGDAYSTTGNGTQYQVAVDGVNFYWRTKQNDPGLSGASNLNLIPLSVLSNAQIATLSGGSCTLLQLSLSTTASGDDASLLQPYNIQQALTVANEGMAADTSGPPAIVQSMANAFATAPLGFTCAPPPVPSKVAVSQGSGTTEALVTWNSAGGTTAGFYVNFASGSPAPCTAGFQTSASQTSLPLGGYATGTYSVSICSFNQFGQTSAPVTETFNLVNPSCPLAMVIGGVRWYLGAAGATCTQTCAAHGGYNKATDSAGEEGTRSQCTKVMAALCAPAVSYEVGNVCCGKNCNSGAEAGMGCFTNSANMTGSGGGWTYRCDDTATTAQGSASGFSRACACND